MTEIWNLSALCRCCHSDGQFKNLDLPYMFENKIEIYSKLLQETLGLQIKPPPLDASYTICEDCITKLRVAARFKKQVLDCEKKFEEYCKNEQAFCPNFESVKVEVDSVDNDNSDFDANYDNVHVKTDDDDVDRKYDSKPTNAQTEYKECKVLNKSVKDIKTEESYVEIAIEGTEIKTIEKAKSSTAKKRSKSTQGKPKRKSVYNASLEVCVKTENGETHSCKACGGTFETKVKLKKHIYNNHTYKQQKQMCNVCNKEFRNITEHMLVHGDERPYKCSYCEKSFFKKHFLLEHVNIHTRERIYQCDLCQKQFLYKQILVKHLAWHAGKNKKFICDTCGALFTDSTNLNIHVRTVHQKLRPFSCEYCPKTFTANKHLKVHRRNHTGETPYKCEACPEAFISYSYLLKHKLKHDKDYKKTYTCKVCKQIFTDKYEFRIHGKSHIGERPYKCHLCHKDFSCKYSCNRHISEHSGIKRFSCDICGQKFTQLVQLKRHHGRFHDPNKERVEPTKCELCKRMVKNMAKHMEAHNNKPYACALCEKRYPENNALTRHVKLQHEGLRPHVCQLCHKAYRQSGNLKSHLAKVHRLGDKLDEDLDNYVTVHTIKRGRKRKQADPVTEMEQS